MKVCIDPGHGGDDSGAAANGIVEKVVNLQVACAVREDLRLRGHEVTMTRGTDDTNPGLTDRGRYSVASGADLFVSIHHDCNTSPSFRGCSSFYYNASCANGKDLGAQITSRLHEQRGLPYAYGTPARVHWKSLGVLRGGDNWQHATACLIECATLSSPLDAALIKAPDYATVTAKIIVDGIVAHAAKEGMIVSAPLGDTGIVVIGPGDVVLTRSGEEHDDDRVWVPLREVAEALGYAVTSHIPDQGKVYLTRAGGA
jgi:N-acetylmuramoyl-L-alanine amidase